MTNFTVTTGNDDAFDGGDLAAETADGGGLSLREALGLANANADVDTITFDASLSGSTLTLSGSELVISNSVTIDGDIDGDNRADITIDANGGSRVFNVTGGTSTLDSLVITGGNAVNGGGINIAGGGGLFFSSPALTVANTTISNNSAVNGGGIFSQGDLTITNSLITGNDATDDGGGIYLVNGDTLITSSTRPVIQ
ncbi:MAG: hypothetical protein JKY60_12450 [Kordiimonadaceae bacterium]|nr:hypothetical protein [Kordiimonadaceae bacterium]